MAHCEDCGTKLTREDICSNCHEELYILEYQAGFIGDVTKEFIEKSQEQQKQIDIRGTRPRMD